MCVSKRWIKNYYGRDILINCGRCPACLQEKAINRTNRIRFNQNYDGSTVTLFVTLTYRNDCIPYFHRSDLFQHEDCNGFVELSVFRDSETRWVVDPTRCHVRSRKSDGVRKLLTKIKVPSLYRNDRFSKLQGQGDDKIGVIYYSDAQNFLKRLRARFNYFKYDKPFSYYCCAEYGPTTCRSHFHFLFTVPSGDFQLWQDSIAQAWSYDDYRRTRNHIEVARNAASYAASYVNSAAVVPYLFKEYAFKQKNSYSKGYGTSPECFSLDKILEAFERRDLRFSVARLRDNALVVDSMLLPRYILHRRFPKFKGFSRLNANALEQLFLRPEFLNEYAGRLDYDTEQLRTTKIMIRNKMNQAVLEGVSVYDYARCWSQIWSVRASNVLRDWYSEVKLISDNFTLYDNIGQFYDGYIPSDSLLDISSFIPDNPLRDPNVFPRNVLRHETLVRSYESYSKDRKIRGHILSSEDFNI